MKKKYLIVLILLNIVSLPVLTFACACKIKNGNMHPYMRSASLAARVKTSLADHLGSQTLESVVVSTYLGDVHLSGFLDSKEEINQAVEITKSVKGVDKVKDDLLVKGPQSQYWIQNKRIIGYDPPP